MPNGSALTPSLFAAVIRSSSTSATTSIWAELLYMLFSRFAHLKSQWGSSIIKLHHICKIAQFYAFVCFAVGGAELSCQCRRHSETWFSPWLGKSPEERATHANALALVNSWWGPDGGHPWAVKGARHWLEWMNYTYLQAAVEWIIAQRFWRHMQVTSS